VLGGARRRLRSAPRWMGTVTPIPGRSGAHSLPLGRLEQHGAEDRHRALLLDDPCARYRPENSSVRSELHLAYLSDQKRGSRMLLEPDGSVRWRRLSGRIVDLGLRTTGSDPGEGCAAFAAAAIHMVPRSVIAQAAQSLGIQAAEEDWTVWTGPAPRSSTVRCVVGVDHRRRGPAAELSPITG